MQYILLHKKHKSQFGEDYTIKANAILCHQFLFLISLFTLLENISNGKNSNNNINDDEDNDNNNIIKEEMKKEVNVKGEKMEMKKKTKKKKEQ